MKLSGWGRYPKIDCRILAPRDKRELRDLVCAERQLIAHGNGRSYGDAALNPFATLMLKQKDHFLAFDPATGILEAEAGILLSDIIETFLPRGWFIPVTPGTKNVSLGGMIAADVHGKNHHKDGSFGAYIDSMQLMLADGRILRCAAGENNELFRATCGGMGLTGVILSARIRMRKVQSAYIRQETVKTRNLDETMAAFEASREWTYCVAWIDCFAGSDSVGRAILYRGEHAKVCELPPEGQARPFQVGLRRAKKIPLGFPAFALNRWSVKLFNAFYYAVSRTGSAIIDYDRYFYPLDAIQDWNRIYGANGLLQYQCVLPKTESRAGIQAILRRVARASSGSFLSVLKLLGPGRGMLSFPMEGYTLAMDFPANNASLVLLDELDAITSAHGGRVYLAKDARMRAPMFSKTYADLEAFKTLRRQIDPDRKFSSLQAERLGL